ncbi:MAG: SEC-C metal-binding domain-containing protein [Bryobacteraceae bacterium]|jgi:SEC-C motif-containing protein
MPEPYALTPIQLNVLDRIAAGATATAAAREAGVHRNTVANWIHTETFQAALRKARHTRDLLLFDAAHPLMYRAVAELLKLLEDPKSSPFVRLRAATALFDRAARYVLPEPEELAQPSVPPAPAAPPAPEIVHFVHKNAQAEFAPPEFKPPARAHSATPAAPKPGRNDLCPCGSGIKFKRCCLGKLPAA